MNNIFDILKLLNAFNQPQNNQCNTQTNPSTKNFPNEAFSQSNNNLNNDNSMLPLIMSLLSKNNDIGKIFTQNSTSKEKEEVSKFSSSPKDEILL